MHSYTWIAHTSRGTSSLWTHYLMAVDVNLRGRESRRDRKALLGEGPYRTVWFLLEFPRSKNRTKQNKIQKSKMEYLMKWKTQQNKPFLFGYTSSCWYLIKFTCLLLCISADKPKYLQNLDKLLISPWVLSSYFLPLIMINRSDKYWLTGVGGDEAGRR